MLLRLAHCACLTSVNFGTRVAEWIGSAIGDGRMIVVVRICFDYGMPRQAGDKEGCGKRGRSTFVETYLTIDGYSRGFL
jgi:hypothetical protein